jgi:hypothetical protein
LAQSLGVTAQKMTKAGKPAFVSDRGAPGWFPTRSLHCLTDQSE